MRTTELSLFLILFLAISACSDDQSEIRENHWDHSINFAWTFAKGELPLSIDPAYAGTREKLHTRLFDGKTLDGWDGDPIYWSVKDEAIMIKKL